MDHRRFSDRNDKQNREFENEGSKDRFESRLAFRKEGDFSQPRQTELDQSLPYERRTVGGMFGTDHAKIEFGERERRRQNSHSEENRSTHRTEVRGGGPEEGAWESVMNFFGIGPKGYRRSDQSLFEDVCESLARHSGVDARDIEVKVKDGLVTLMGSVPSRRMKRLAEDCLDDVSGVTDVQNQLRVSDRSTLATHSAATPQSTSGVRTSSSPEKMQ